jgi:hypothetical protein
VGAITRGIKLYNVWAGDGDPVASVEFGVTVENWGGRLVAVMTIDETSNKFSKPWDSGFSVRSDMRSSPNIISGNGGSIDLLDNGWYKNFLNAGYSIAGSRAERTWDENGETKFSQNYADSVKSGIGSLIIRLLDMSTQMDADIESSESPLIVGQWNSAEIKRTANSSGEELIDGIGDVIFKIVSPSTTAEEDEAGAPLSYSILIAPSVSDFGTSLVFPENSYCRVFSGHNEGSVLKVDAGSYPYLTFDVEGSPKGFFDIILKNDYGIPIDDTNELGLVTDLLTADSITEMSTFEFFTQKQEFNVGSDTIVSSPIIVNGESVNNFTVEDGTITVQSQFLSNPILSSEFVNNDDYDMTEYLLYPNNETLDVNRVENMYYLDVTSLISYDNTDSVSNKVRTDTQSIVSTVHRAISLDLTFWGYRTSIASSYYVENVSTESQGMCLDVSYNIPNLPNFTTIAMTVRIVVVGVWDGSGEWLSQEYEEIVHEQDVEFTFTEGGDGFTNIKNFGTDYFTDNAPNKQMEIFDDRYESEDDSGNRYARGRIAFEFADPDILKASPDRLYVLINGSTYFETTAEYTGTGDSELIVNELGFFGETSSSSADNISSITATLTGEDWGTLDTAIQNIAETQDWNSFENVVVNVPELPYPVKTFITKASELKTKTALKRILKEAWCVGYIDRDGEYTVVDVSGKMGDDTPVATTHDFVLPHGYFLESELDQYNSDDLVTGGTISYDRDSLGNFRKSISITNADKDVFDTSYVTGFTDLGTAQILWNKCHLIWLKTGVLTDVRRDLSELWWLYRDSDAIRYFTNIVEWNGGSDFARDVITVDIGVTKIDTDTSVLPWNIGDPCRLTIPIKMNSAYSGVIEGVKYGADYTAVITVRVAEIVESVDRIIETGLSTTDKITEDGINTTDKITELGIV